MILLSAPKDLLMRQIVAALDRIVSERSLLAAVREDLRNAASQSAWEGVLRAAGGSLSPFGLELAPQKSIHSEVTLARLHLYPDVKDAVSFFDENDPLQKAERHLREVMSGQNRWGAINPLLYTSFYRHYSFGMMAADEAAAQEREAPPVIAAAWRVAHLAGPWWPFVGSVVVSDRPAEIHLNSEYLLHREGGPAALFRDGMQVWAWHGRAMREEWIMNPEKISARDLKCFEASFREYVASRATKVNFKRKLKPSSILTKELPPAAEDRIAALRAHNKGSLPFFDRYIAGEHRQVWEELIKLGPSAREDPHAADALAVAFETMRRVDTNVRTVTARLRGLDYKFANEPHDSPGPDVRRQIAKIEKMVGALPLSVRAFYEMVGAVNWIGHHESLAPWGDPVMPDPLVVFSIDDVIAQHESGWFEDSEDKAIVIAPDDLHKANTSGGEPYEIAVPDLNADGKLLNERHDLYFVPYLRVVFQFGGFPGYDGFDPVPRAIAALRQELVPF